MIARLAIALVLVSATTVCAAELPPLEGADVDVTLRKSSSKFFPAKTDGPREGTATVLCTITAKGELSDCAVQSERPAGFGFGAATVQLATEIIRIGPKAKDGSPTAGRRFLFPMKFKPQP